MTNIREIIEKYVYNNPICDSDGDEHNNYSIDEDDFDKLEKELQRLMTKAVNKAYDNAKRKLAKK